MSRIAPTMSDDHRRCDDLYAEAEALAADERWPEARAAAEAFVTAMQLHLGLEENTLFPAFEQRTGMTGGPTMIMRMEHTQMRQVMDEMREAAGAGQREGFLGSAETLLMLMQQHNLKEEQILYPMLDQAVGDQADTLLAGLATP